MNPPRPYVFSPRNQGMILRYLLSRVRGRPVKIKTLAARYGLGQAWVGQILDRWICRVTGDCHSEFRWAEVDGESRCIRNPIRRQFWARFRSPDSGRAFVRALWAGDFIARPTKMEIEA